MISPSAPETTATASASAIAVAIAIAIATAIALITPKRAAAAAPPAPLAAPDSAPVAVTRQPPPTTNLALRTRGGSGEASTSAQPPPTAKTAASSSEDEEPPERARGRRQTPASTAGPPTPGAMSALLNEVLAEPTAIGPRRGKGTPTMIAAAEELRSATEHGADITELLMRAAASAAASADWKTGVNAAIIAISNARKRALRAAGKAATEAAAGADPTMTPSRALQSDALRLARELTTAGQIAERKAAAQRRHTERQNQAEREATEGAGPAGAAAAQKRHIEKDELILCVNIGGADLRPARPRTRGADMTQDTAEAAADGAILAQMHAEAEAAEKEDQTTTPAEQAATAAAMEADEAALDAAQAGTSRGWQLGPKIRDAMERAEEQDALFLGLVELHDRPRQSQGSGEKLTRLQRRDVLEQLIRMRQWNVASSWPTGHDPAAGVMAIWREARATKTAEENVAPGRTLHVGLRASSDLLGTQTDIVLTYLHQVGTSESADAERARQATMTPLRKYSETALWIGDLNGNWPEDSGQARQRRGPMFNNAFIAKAAEECGLTRLGRKANTNVYVAVKEPRRLASSCIDHAAAGATAAVHLRARPLQSPLAGKEIGHSMLTVSWKTWVTQGAPAAPPRAKVAGRRHPLRLMPTDSTLQERIEWARGQGRGAGGTIVDPDKAPPKGWAAFAQEWRGAVTAALDERDQAQQQTDFRQQQPPKASETLRCILHALGELFDECVERERSDLCGDGGAKSGEKIGSKRSRLLKKADRWMHARAMVEELEPDDARFRRPRWPPAGYKALKIGNDEELKALFTEEAQTLQPKELKRRELEIINQRHRTAAVTFEKFIERENWTALTDKITELEKQGSAAFVADVWSILARHSKSAYDGSMRKEPKGIKTDSKVRSIKASRDRNWEGRQIKEGEVLHEQDCLRELAETGEENFAEKTISTLAVGHLLLRVGIERNTTHDGTPPVSADGVPISLDASWRQEAWRQEKARQQAASEAAATVADATTAAADIREGEAATAGAPPLRSEARSPRSATAEGRQSSAPEGEGRGSGASRAAPPVQPRPSNDKAPTAPREPPRSAAPPKTTGARSSRSAEGHLTPAPPQAPPPPPPPQPQPPSQPPQPPPPPPQQPPSAASPPSEEETPATDKEPPPPPSAADVMRTEGKARTQAAMEASRRWGMKWQVLSHGMHIDQRPTSEEFLDRCFTGRAVRVAQRRFTADKATGKSGQHGRLCAGAKGIEDTIAELLKEMTRALDLHPDYRAWPAALAVKPLKSRLEYKSYRELWVQEHLWITLLSCVRATWDDQVGRTRAWAQAGWERGRGHLEVLLGVTLNIEQTALLRETILHLFLDYKRFHAEISMTLRFFLDSWVGVHPDALAILAANHLQATGEFRTAWGVTPPFPMACGAGIGCPLAAVSSINCTTVVARLMQRTCAGFELATTAANPLKLSVNQYADDMQAASQRKRDTQLQADAMARASATLRVPIGHDELKASKTAVMGDKATAAGWASEAINIKMPIGEHGADVDLAIATKYPYLGKTIGAAAAGGATGKGKLDVAIDKASALLGQLGSLAAGSTGSLAAMACAIIHGVFDSAAATVAATPRQIERVNVAARAAMVRAGHGLPHSMAALAHLPTNAGGQGVEPAGPTIRSALAGIILKTLRGRDGEDARASTESGLRIAALRFGHDPDGLDAPTIDFMPDGRLLELRADPTQTFDAFWTTLSDAEAGLQWGGGGSQGPLQPPPLTSSRATRQRAREAQGPRLEDIDDITPSPLLYNLGIWRLGDARAESDEWMDADALEATYRAPSHPLTPAERARLQLLTRELNGSAQASGWLRTQHGVPMAAELAYARRRAEAASKRRWLAPPAAPPAPAEAAPHGSGPRIEGMAEITQHPLLRNLGILQLDDAREEGANWMDAAALEAAYRPPKRPLTTEEREKLQRFTQELARSRQAAEWLHTRRNAPKTAKRSFAARWTEAKSNWRRPPTPPAPPADAAPSAALQRRPPPDAGAISRISHSARAAERQAEPEATEGACALAHVGWCKQTTDGTSWLYEALLEGAPRNEAAYKTAQELRWQVKQGGVRGMAPTEAAEWLEERLRSAEQHRSEPQSFNDHIDEQWGKEEAARVRRLASQPPSMEGAAAADMRLNDEFIDEYAPRMRHGATNEHTIKEQRTQEAAARWRPRPWPTAFVTELDRTDPEGGQTPSLKPAFPTTGDKDLRQKEKELEARAQARYPEVNWTAGAKELWSNGQAGNTLDQAARRARQRPLLRPFVRSHHLESGRTWIGIGNERKRVTMQAKELESLAAEPTRRTIRVLAMLEADKNDKARAAQGSQEAAGSSDAAATQLPPLETIVGCGDGSLTPLESGRPLNAAAVWLGFEEEPTSTGDVIAPALAVALPAGAEIYDDETVAMLLFFLHALEKARSNKAEDRRPIWAVYTGDCEGPVYDTEAMYQAGSARGNGRPIRQAAIHETIQWARQSIEALGGYTDIVREPAHNGAHGNTAADAVAKSACWLPVANRVPLDIRTFLPMLVAKGGFLTGHQAETKHVIPGGDARPAKLLRKRLVELEHLRLVKGSLRFLTIDREPAATSLLPADSLPARFTLESRMAWAANHHERNGFGNKVATQARKLEAKKRLQRGKMTPQQRDDETRLRDERARAYPILNLAAVPAGPEISMITDEPRWTPIVRTSSAAAGSYNGEEGRLTRGGLRRVIKAGEPLCVGGRDCPMCRRKNVRPDIIHVLTECEEGASHETLEHMTDALMRLADLLAPPADSAQAWWGVLLDDILATIRVLDGGFNSDTAPEMAFARHQACSVLSGMLARPDERLREKLQAGERTAAEAREKAIRAKFPSRNKRQIQQLIAAAKQEEPSGIKQLEAQTMAILDETTDTMLDIVNDWLAEHERRGGSKRWRGDAWRHQDEEEEEAGEEKSGRAISQIYRAPAWLQLGAIVHVRPQQAHVRELYDTTTRAAADPEGMELVGKTVKILLKDPVRGIAFAQAQRKKNAGGGGGAPEWEAAKGNGWLPFRAFDADQEDKRTAELAERLEREEARSQRLAKRQAAQQANIEAAERAKLQKNRPREWLGTVTLRRLQRADAERAPWDGGATSEVDSEDEEFGKNGQARQRARSPPWTAAVHDAITRRRQQRDGRLPEEGIRAEEVTHSVEAAEDRQGLREEVRAALTHLRRQQEIALQSEPRDELGLQVLEAATRQRRPEGQAARPPPTAAPAEETGAPAAPTAAPTWLQGRPDDDDEGREVGEASAPGQPPKRRRSYQPDYLMRRMGASAPDLARKVLEALGPCPPLPQPGPQGQTRLDAEEDNEIAQQGTTDVQHDMELDGAAASSRPQAWPDRQRRARQEDGKAGSSGNRSESRHKYAAKARQRATRKNGEEEA